MTSPTQSAERRPPLLFAFDGLAHAMRDSKYLDADVQPIHAHDLALVNHFVSFMSGKRKLNNGGMILGTDSQSNRPSVPAFDFAIERNAAIADAHPQIAPPLAGQEGQGTQIARGQEAESAQKQQGSKQTKQGPIPDTHKSANTGLTTREKARETALTKSPRKHPGQPRPPDPRFPTRQLDRFPSPQIPEWNPHVRVDQRVLAAMEGVSVREIRGLSREEARGIMEYYARSGMLRQRISEGFVQEKWTLAGGGIVGELERGSLYRA